MPINEKSVKSEVLQAVREDGMQLQHASDQLKRYMGVYRAAIKQNSESLQFLEDITITTMSIAIIEAAIKKSPLSIKHIPESIEGYEELVKIALEVDRNAIEVISDTFKDDNKQLITDIMATIPPKPRMRPVQTDVCGPPIIKI